MRFQVSEANPSCCSLRMCRPGVSGPGVRLTLLRGVFREFGQVAKEPMWDLRRKILRSVLLISLPCQVLLRGPAGEEPKEAIALEHCGVHQRSLAGPGRHFLELPSHSLTWKWKMASWKTTFLYTQDVPSTSMLVSRSVFYIIMVTWMAWARWKTTFFYKQVGFPFQ